MKVTTWRTPSGKLWVLRWPLGYRETAATDMQQYRMQRIWKSYPTASPILQNQLSVFYVLNCLRLTNLEVDAKE